jgi:hypothetical protein
MEKDNSFSIEETLQETADNMRLLKIGLRTHDPMTLSAAIKRIADKYGEQFAQDIACTTITTLMLEEDWSFEMENGESSPLM